MEKEKKSYNELLGELVEAKKEETRLLSYQINELMDKYNRVVEYAQYNDEFIEALRFLDKFGKYTINNDALRNKALNTKYEELNYKQTTKPILNKIDKKNDGTQTIQISGSDYTNIISNCCYPIFTTHDNTQDLKEYINEKISEITNPPEEPKEEEKVKWEEKVGYVLEHKDKFSKEVLYNVYKFLEELIKKDKELNKWKDKN